MDNKLILKIVLWVIVAGFGIYLLIKYRDTLRNFFDEVIVELKKSSWPTWQELRESTVIVSIAIVALSICVALYDFIFLWIISHLTGHNT